MKRNIGVLAAGVCAVAMGLVPAGAIAKKYNITVSGTASGNGSGNSFGLATSFSDISFTIVYQYRDDIIGAHYWANGHTVDGGSEHGTVAPLILKSLTLNGLTKDFTEFTNYNAGAADVQSEYVMYSYSGSNISGTEHISAFAAMKFPSGNSPQRFV